MDIGGKAQAERCLRLTRAACEWLTEHPLLGSGDDFVRPGHCCLPVRLFRVFYRLGADGHVDGI
ncbi:hypothetical protein CHU95_17535 [Niveispirillum lacus]|uniref:Plasmid stabilization protein n=1 Tax=Niveispirillum lacus TaxID=1981099 RepID=A0A255YTP0_9PROT|nr:hypothetical protein CHU95_17535 [Niveispirillum lacus]